VCEFTFFALTLLAGQEGYPACKTLWLYLHSTGSSVVDLCYVSDLQSIFV